MALKYIFWGERREAVERSEGYVGRFGEKGTNWRELELDRAKV